MTCKVDESSLPGAIQGGREQPLPDASNQIVDWTTMSEHESSEQSIPAAKVLDQLNVNDMFPPPFLSHDIISIEEVDIHGLLNPDSKDRSSPDRQRDE